MVMTTLPQRLESEAHEYEVTDLERLEHHGDTPLKAIPVASTVALSHSILEDMLARLPEQKPAAASVYAPHYRDNRQHDCDYTLQVQLNNELNKGYNQAVAEITAALTAYCIGEGGTDARK